MKKERKVGSSSSPNTDTNWVLDKLSGIQKKLIDIVASSSPSSLERLPLNFPRPKQISDYVYEVCKPTHGRRPSVELVFFHGLQLEGSEDACITTWLSQDRSNLWLNWLLEDFPNVRILIISYDAASKRTSSEGNTDMYITRENLVHLLIGMEARVGQDGCPVVLVGHCLGGLVMRELCVQANSILSQDSSNEALENLLWNIKGFFSYATPHQGSKMADKTTTEGPAGLLFKDMTVLNKNTARRNEHFRKLRKKYGWRTFGVGENREVNLGNFKGFVVTEASARHDVDSFYTVDANHFQICRPGSRISNSFQQLKSFVGEVLKEDAMRIPPEMNLSVEVIGLESQTKRVEELLQATQRLCIVGIGGIGKTTLAKALFDGISGTFEYACFLHKIKHSLTGEVHRSDLRKQIIDNLYWHGRKVSTSFDWMTLRGKRVLIILDDARFESQVDVMTEKDGFSNESRLIVTSRDKGFLIPLDFVFHKAEGLSLDDSKVLFCLHAFKKRVAPRAFEEQVMKFAKKSGGLPLALKVSGGYLYSRRKDTWDDAFKKFGLAESLNGSREDGLWSILRVSYDSLALTEQKLFLDAATVFHRKLLTTTQSLWKGCGWAAESGWENLLDRCLVTLSSRGYIGMHDVLRDFGKSIACPDPHDVTTHTRISDIKTAIRLWDVLSARCQQGQGTTAKVEVLSLIGDDTSDQFDISVIQGLEHLRILQLRDLNVRGSVNVFPNKLSVLEFDFHHGCIQRGTADGGLPKALGALVSLRFLKIIHHDGLTSLPETLEQLRALEGLHIYDCKNLVELPDSIGKLQELRSLEIDDCPCLRALPESLGQLQALELLSVDDCGSLTTLPESLGALEVLQRLHVRRCPKLEALPESLGQLQALELLGIEDCGSLTRLLQSLGQLGALQRLHVVRCPKFEALPESLGQLQALELLSVQDCGSLTTLPESLGALEVLQRLHVRRCPKLEALPESLGQLQALELSGIEDCGSLTRLRQSLGQLGALQRLHVVRCPKFEALPESLGQLQALELLSIEDCESLTILPQSLGQLGALQRLHVLRCPKFEALELLPLSMVSRPVPMLETHLYRALFQNTNINAIELPGPPQQRVHADLTMVGHGGRTLADGVIENPLRQDIIDIASSQVKAAATRVGGPKTVIRVYKKVHFVQS